MTSAFHLRTASAESRLANLLANALIVALREAAKDGSLRGFLANPAASADTADGADALALVPIRSTPTPRGVPLPREVPTPTGDLCAPLADAPALATAPAVDRTVSDLERECEILTTLGGNRFGETLLGRQRGSGASVTIHLANRILPVAETQIERTRQAAAVLRHHDHAHVTKVLASGSHLGRPFVVHEAVHGRALSDIIPTRCPMPEHDVLRLAEQVALGLQFIHLIAGVVHGDLRPSCVLIEFSSIAGGIEVRESETAKVSEFLGPRIPWHDLELAGPLAVPSYVAPEQLDHAAHDPRTDIYAIGAIMHHLLTGEPPVTGTQAEAVATLRTRRTVDLSRLPDTISDQTRSLLAVALAPDPKKRFLAYQGFIVACRRAMNPDLRHNLRSMRFLRKPLMIPVVPRPVDRSALATPLPSVIPDPLLAAVQLGAEDEPDALVANDLENLDLGTRILRKHVALGKANRPDVEERKRSTTSSHLRRTALSRNVATGVVVAAAAARRESGRGSASSSANQVDRAARSTPTPPPTSAEHLTIHRGSQMLRRDLGVLVPALLIIALISIILLGISLGWFHV